jgi:hypothetical protein
VPAILTSFLPMLHSIQLFSQRKVLIIYPNSFSDPNTKHTT